VFSVKYTSIVSVSIVKNKSVCSSYSFINIFTLSIKPNSVRNGVCNPLEILRTSSSALSVKVVISFSSIFCDFIFIRIHCCPTLLCSSLAILVRSSCACSKPYENCSCNFFRYCNGFVPFFFCFFIKSILTLDNG
jgi:hypothetical protein